MAWAGIRVGQSLVHALQLLIKAALLIVSLNTAITLAC